MLAVATLRPKNPPGRTQRRRRKPARRGVDCNVSATATPAFPSADVGKAREEGTRAELQAGVAAAHAAPAGGSAVASPGQQQGRENAPNEQHQRLPGESVAVDGHVDEDGRGRLPGSEKADEEAEENPPSEWGSETHGESDDDGCDVRDTGSSSDASCWSSSLSCDGDTGLDRLYASAAAKLAGSASSSPSTLREREKLKTRKFSLPPAVTDGTRLYLATDKKTGATKLDLSYVAGAVVEKRPRPGAVAKEKVERQVKPTSRGPKKSEGRGGKKEPATAGPGWFNMPATALTPELKLDLEVLRLRGVLDRSRHYKKGDMTAGPPKFFQTGTVIAGPTDYYASRLTRRERKGTMIDELVADAESSQYYKRKFLEIQEKKRSGGKKRPKLSGRAQLKRKR